MLWYETKSILCSFCFLYIIGLDRWLTIFQAILRQWKGTNNINLLDCLNASNIAKFAFYASNIVKFAFYQFNSPAIDTLMLSQCPGQLPLTICITLSSQTLFFTTLSLHVEAALLINTDRFPDYRGDCQGHSCSANTIYSSGLKTHQQQEFQT